MHNKFLQVRTSVSNNDNSMIIY